MRKVLFFIVIFCLLLILIPALLITYNGFNDRTGKSDIAVVLGTTVYPNGQMAPFLKGRVDEALKRYRAGDFPLIMVSGGKGVEGHDEAQVMANYLISQGVPQDAVIVDSDGINTGATAQSLKKVMDERQLKTATIMTQFFHIPRTRMALACVGIDAPYSSYSREFNIRDVYSTLREVPAYLLYWWRC